MKINWGHKLIIVFLVFGSLMGYLVYSSVKTNFDLVSKEYYKDELAYQQVIDGTNRANALSSVTTITEADSFIVITLPTEMKGSRVKGDAWFYNAADAKKDEKMSLDIDSDAQQYIPASIFAAGKYKVKIGWECNGQQYYTEQSISIQ